MKKLVIAFAAVGAVLALRPVLKRKARSKMREHCRQMAAKCKQMMAQFGGGEEGEMPERCKEMAASEEEGEAGRVPSRPRNPGARALQTEGRRPRRSQQGAEHGLAGLRSASGRSKWPHARQYARREARA